MTRSRSVIADRIGDANAERLSRLVGGTRLHVSLTVAPSPKGGGHNFPRLAKRVGYDLAVLLVLHFGGCRVYVPRTSHSAPIDPRRIARLDARGWSASRIARHLGCSDRTVHAKRALNRQPTEKTP